MAIKIKDGYKLRLDLISSRETGRIRTTRIHDMRTGKDWTAEHAAERGVLHFASLSDMVESINWNVNGDSRRFRYTFGPRTNDGTPITAYVYA